MAIVINNETGLAEDLGEDLVHKALSSGSHGVPLIDPEGNTGNFPIEEARTLLSQGYQQPNPEQLQGLFKHGKYGTTEQKVKSFLEGAASDVTFGASAGLERGLGIATAEDMRGRAEENPGTKMLGGIAGFAASQLTGIGAAKTVINAGQTAAKALGLGLKGATTGSKIAAEAVKIGVESTLLGTGSEVEKMFHSDPAQSIESAAAHIGLSAVFGAMTGGAFGAVPPLWKAANESKLAEMLKSIRGSAEKDLASTEGELTMRPLLRKFLHVSGGVPEEVIDDYLANSDLVSKVPGFEELHEHAYKHIQNLTKDLSTKKLNASKARADLKAYEKEVRESLIQQGYDLAQATKRTKELAQNALAHSEMEIQSKALDQSQTIFDAVKKLKDDVWIESEKAFEVAAEHPDMISLNPLFKHAEELQDKIRSKGTIEGNQLAERLGKYVEHLQSEFGSEVRPPQAKLLIQGLDEVSTYNRNATAFDEGLSRYYKQLRHGLNKQLKTDVPAYGKHMKGVAEKADLLERLDQYGTPEDAMRHIKTLKEVVNYRTDIPLLQKLEKETGIKFLADIENYANPEHRKALLEAIPELKNAEKMAEALEAIKNPETQKAMKDQIALSEFHKNHIQAEQELAAATAAQKELSGITEGTLQGKMNTVKSGRSIHGRNQLEGLPGLEHIPELKGKSIPELLDLLRVQEAFEKTSTQGSRKVNMYGAILGATFGAATGGFGGFLGGLGGGAALGGAMDLYGPAVTKKILDSYISKFGDLAKAAGTTNTTATKMAMYKFLSGAEPMTAEAFKVQVDLAEAVLKTDKMSTKAIDAIFNGTKAIFSEEKADQSLDGFKKNMAKLNLDPSAMLEAGGHMGQESSEAMGQVSARALTYLESQRPSTDKLGVLDGERKPSQAEEATYQRVLSIADKPLSVLKHVEQGTVTLKDVEVIKTIYPSYYMNLCEKMTQALIAKTSKGESIPYKTRLSLSQFLGQPLDSSMTPQSLMANKKALMQQVDQQAQQPKPQGQGSMKSLKNTSKSQMTPGQLRQDK